jgi:hypothetical protein
MLLQNDTNKDRPAMAAAPRQNATFGNPLLRIDTAGADDDHQLHHISLDLSSSSPPHSPFRLSIDTSPQPQPSLARQGANEDRVLHESRKLLAHILKRLQNRPMPPSTFEQFKINAELSLNHNLGAIVETVRGAIRFGKMDTRMQLPIGAAEDDDDGGETDSFTTDTTYDLMSQLKDILGVLRRTDLPKIFPSLTAYTVVSLRRGWQIFLDRCGYCHCIGLQ